jgi:hypothetical protein
MPLLESVFGIGLKMSYTCLRGLIQIMDSFVDSSHGGSVPEMPLLMAYANTVVFVL